MIITITEVGTIGRDLRFEGIDNAGIFGQPGMSLVGQGFTSTFIGTCDNCRSFNDGVNGPSPIIDATLTINGYTFDFGPGLADDMNFGLPQTTQVNFLNGTFMFINPGGNGLGAGAFQIGTTSGSFVGEYISNSFNVPGPEVGGGLLGLAIILIWALVYLKNKCGFCANYRG